MWAWCCRKLCPCCCCFCPWCCFCHGKDGDLAELVTSAECGNTVADYYTIRKLSSVRATSSQEDVDSSADLQGSRTKQMPRGNAKEILGVSPAMYWSPTIHKVQPEIDTSIESKTTLATSMTFGYSSKSGSRWHRALHKLRPRCSHHENIPMEEPCLAGGDMVMTVPQITASAPNLVDTDLSHNRKRLLLTCKSNPKLQHAAVYPNPPLVHAQHKQVHWLKSQSMQDINALCTSPPSKKVCDQAALMFGINTSLYSMSDPMYPVPGRSNEAFGSWRTAGEGDCYPEPSYGEIQFTVAYQETTKKLFVHVSKAQDLPPKGECFKYNVVLRVCILPDEKRAKMTSAVSGDLSPSFSEQFQFLVRKLEGRVLRVSAFDADFAGRYDAIGHSLFYLEDMPVGERASYAMKLFKQSQPYQYPGAIEVSLHYDGKRDKLTVHVIQARNLALTPQTAHNWRSIDNFNTYVKVAYFCAGHKLKSRKSPQVLNSTNPIYDFTSEFLLASNYPHEIFMVLTVLVPGLLRKDSPVGRLIFGPFYYAHDLTETPWGRAIRSGEVVTHWYNMFM